MTKRFNHEKIDIGYQDLDATTTKSGRTYKDAKASGKNEKKSYRFI